jgi:hypothetical protein
LWPFLWFDFHNHEQASTFMVQPLRGRTAFAVLHFLELLVGPRCQTLAVKNPRHYHFDKAALMTSMVQLAVQLAQHPLFPQALAEEQDFEVDILQKATDLLTEQHSYAAAEALSGVLARIMKTPGHLAKKQRLAGLESSSVAAAGAAVMDGSSIDGGSGAAAAAAISTEVDGLVAQWLQVNAFGNDVTLVMVSNSEAAVLP